MRVELTGRHVNITPALRRLVDRKLSRLERVLNDSALSAQIVLTDDKRGRRADVTQHARGEQFLHGDGASAAWETSLTQAFDKIAKQAQKVKGKWQEWKRRGVKGATAASEEPVAPSRSPARPRRVRPRMPRILRASRQAVKPMSVADAALEVEANGEGVVVFRDVETAAISVLYRRTNGELVLVETEI
jgi:putative sigma-54 modulation protein